MEEFSLSEQKNVRVSFSIDDVARALSITKRTAERRASKEHWPYEETAVRGGKKRLYPINHLPKMVAQQVFAHACRAGSAETPAADVSPATPPAVAVTVDNFPSLRQAAGADNLNDRQRDCERARERIIAYIDKYPGSITRAVDQLNADRVGGRLAPPMVWAFAHAWEKPRRDNRMTKSTYDKWCSIRKTRGRLAPLKIKKDFSVKPWYPLLLELCQRPQGSSFWYVTREIAAAWKPEWGKAPPSYHAVRRACRDKISALDQIKGRYSGSQLRAHRHWRPRTAEGLLPFQEVHADGWNTHFTAPHPITGLFVTYEVWHFHDVATRFVPRPGIGLSETYEVITAGLENCVRVGGIPAILQTDSTKVVKLSPRFTADPFTSLADRAGFTVVHPVTVGNSQANGICENFNRSWLDSEARALATYQAREMDGLSLKRVKKLTEKMVKAANAGDLDERERLYQQACRAGKGHVFRSYQEAVEWINETIDKYNDRPHRSLPMIDDPATGKQRNQTPREALQAHIDAGWRPVMPADEQIVDLFRPHVRCKVTREAVSPIGNGQRYYHPSLGAWNGSHVMVAVDPMDWHSVVVKTLEGEAICTADLVQATGYRAKTSYEIAEEKRARAQMRRNAEKAQQILSRTGGTPLDAPKTAPIIIGGHTWRATAVPPVKYAHP